MCDRAKVGTAVGNIVLQPQYDLELVCGLNQRQSADCAGAETGVASSFERHGIMEVATSYAGRARSLEGFSSVCSYRGNRRLCRSSAAAVAISRNETAFAIRGCPERIGTRCFAIKA